VPLVDAVHTLVNAATDLQDILSSQDRPVWLHPILSAAQDYLRSKGPDHAKHLLEKIAENFGRIVPIKLEHEAESPCDFDKLYEHLRAHRRIAELFDELVEKITEIIRSGEIDSITVLTSLQQMMAVLKANHKGSYVGTRGAFRAVRYLQNLIKAFLKSLPVIRELIEAFEETLRQTEEELQALDEELDNQMQKTVLEQLPRLERLSKTTAQQSLMLPGPGNPETNEE